MTKQSWKGVNLTYDVYAAALATKVSSENKKGEIVLMRRNLVPTKSMLAALAKNTFSVYNGYDFFEKSSKNMKLGFNFGASVPTRELDVRHKVKLTKQARKNLQLKKSKKAASGATTKNSKQKRKTTPKKK